MSAAETLRQIESLWAMAGEHKARAILQALGSKSALTAFDRLAATFYARKLLAAGEEKRSVAYRIAARFDVSVKTAYRRIKAALNMGPLWDTAAPVLTPGTGPIDAFTQRTP